MGQDKLTQTFQLLNNIEVKGRQNMMNLLAAMQLIEEVKASGMDCCVSANNSSGSIPNGGQANPQS